MKKLNLISLDNDSLRNNELQATKGGGVCACKHQNCRRSHGMRRGGIIEIIGDETER